MTQDQGQKTDRWQQVEELFDAALKRAPHERAAFLAEACGSDSELRAEIASLLAAHEEPGSFIDAPAYQAVADSLAETQAPFRAAQHVGQVIGHYKILGLLGKGGMGEVYLAFDTSLDRKVALKLLPPQFTTEADRVRRFEQEAKAASALNHPNILTIHEIGREGDLYFMATEFVEGQTLRHLIDGGKVNLQETLEVALQVAAALSAAHAAGIVHRDIKPENIMLRPDGYIKVLDFGLAKLTEKTAKGQFTDTNAPTRAPLETEPGTIMGTLSYMSPEQARGQKVDARTDIWSLGVVIYEMTTGQMPFSGPTVSDIIVSILDRQPASLMQHLGPVPPELEHIVTKALAKDCEERYQAIQDLGIELKGLKRRLEIEAELGSAAKPESSNTAAAGMTDEKKPLDSAAPPKTAAEPPKRAFSPLLIAVAALLVIAVIGIVAWNQLRPLPSAPATSAPITPPVGPERRLSYSLTVQKMRDGKPYQEPFESSGQEIFENGYKFRLNFSSPQAGHLYLLNEGPDAGGKITYNLLFATPITNTGQAQPEGKQRIQTGWYKFDEHPGTEKFWLIWAAAPVRELEAVKGAINPTLTDPNQIKAVQEFLNTSAASKPEIEKDKVKKQTNVKGRGEILVSLIELEHR